MVVGGFSPGVLEFLRSINISWARQLLGAKPWSNAAACHMELGWTFEVSDRIAIDIAMARKKSWILENTIAGRLFRNAHASVVLSWTLVARQLLANKNLLDWPLWVTRNGQGTYKSYVKSSLVRPASTQLKNILKLNLPWNVLLSRRAVIQLRRGYIELGYAGSRKCMAKI